MSRPKISLAKEPLDRYIEMIGMIGLLMLFGLPIYYYSDLPETIPTHFNAEGIPDGFSGKNMIWFLPLLGGILYAGLFYLNKLPHLFNYPKNITEENAPHYYKIATRMTRVLSSFLTCSFAYMTLSTIQTALEQKNGLGPYFVYIFLGFMFSVVVYFSLQLRKSV